MSRPAILVASIAFLTVGIKVASAVDACSAGASTNSVTINALAGAFNQFSVPFTRPPVYCGTIESVSGNQVTVTPATVPAVTTAHYLVITSGTKEGAIYGVISGQSNSVTVSGCEDLTGVGTGDQVSVIPYWTLATLWPGLPPANITGGANAGVATVIAIFSPASQSFVLYYYKTTTSLGGSGWRSSTSTSGDASTNAILPYQTIRVSQNPGMANLSFSLPPTGGSGYEVNYQTRACLITAPFPVGWNDNFVSNYHFYPSGSGQTLAASGLASSFMASDLGATSQQINDKLLVFDTTQPKGNPKHIYIYDGTRWLDLTDPPYTDHSGDKVFESGTGVILERVPNSNTVIWVNPP